ncbi:nuclear transport factor 2 family protein [Mucilaginibacter sp. BJC16-A38]|uniref:nuclear transport factor 2 family protein n=1 Tax=Mucilaginibacter phenanthrenivorans TaxID=1234842 RepID=UPI0021576D41|nr:nuclear transport factor 2 family protein [Mucilaginibacter phenanthrenivorans]MCR8557150.1 nuclear transport factor 2 family protein [Mucilaginibacter phenanthrenivorans]
MTTIPEIATRLASLCNELKFVEAYTELYADDAVSIDPNYKNEPFTGLHNLIEREKQFLANVEIHDVKVSEGIFAGNYFSVIFSMHFTPKGQESKMIEELCVYKVEKGKIVSQQFFIG